MTEKKKRVCRRSRQTRYVASGRQIACVIRDPVAREALKTLERDHGGVTAAITHALAAAGEKEGRP